MNILIIGSGGREHALAEAYSKSTRVKKVFVAPGNDLMEESSSKIQTVPNIGVFDIDEIEDLSRKENIDIVDVSSDDPLGAGFVDRLSRKGITAFGPNKNAAEIEWNKAWARDFMKKYKLPIPYFKTFSNTQKAVEYIKRGKKQLLFIKAAGLAAGKGVIRADTTDQAINAVKSMKKFGKAGKTFVIEHGLIGEEFSLFAICDGDSYQILSTAQDHKTAYTGGIGPNTGGMGCVTPTGAITKAALKAIQEKILIPFIKGMREENRPYVGILYLGGMITKKGPEIVEFNARWGDPEAEVILPGITNDYASLIESVVMDDLEQITVKHDGKIRVSIAGCAKGYPEDYRKALGKKIYGLEKAQKASGVQIFGAGVKRAGKHYVVSGGRIFHLVASGRDIFDARRKAYNAMSQIYVEGNNLHFRTDIGFKELERSL